MYYWIMKGKKKSRRQKTALEHVLLGLLPYTEENFALAFHPHRFFNELEKLQGISKAQAKSAYYHARSKGYIETSGARPLLSQRGHEIVAPFRAQYLGKHARLLVIFDIPERRSASRTQLRRLLLRLKFVQVQRSVWATDQDYRHVVLRAIKELQVESYVELHESLRLFPR